VQVLAQPLVAVFTCERHTFTLSEALNLPFCDVFHRYPSDASVIVCYYFRHILK